MLNIEKYKDEILNSSRADLTCCVNDSILGKNCYRTCNECKKSVMEWLLSEAKEPILDDVERKYLSDVIRPFRKEVTTISKFLTLANDAHYIYIEMKDDRGCTLPFFPKNTMYKGMKDGRHYSLKELGL